MIETHGLRHAEILADWPIGRWSYQLVVDAQIFEMNSSFALAADAIGMEDGKAMFPAKHQAPIGQLARTAVVELVAIQSITSIVIRKLSRLGVETSQAMQCAHPQVAMQILLDARNVLTGCPGYRFKTAAAEVVSHQAIAHRAYPKVALAVLSQGAWQEKATFQAACNDRVGNELRSKFGTFR